MSNRSNNPGGPHSNRGRGGYHHHHSSSSRNYPPYPSSSSQQRPPSQSHYHPHHHNPPPPSSSHYGSQNYYQGNNPTASGANVGGGSNFHIPRRQHPPAQPAPSSSSSTSLSIPRKQHHPPPPSSTSSSSKPKKLEGPRITVESECPFVLKIKTMGLPNLYQPGGGIPLLPRAKKSKSPSPPPPPAPPSTQRESSKMDTTKPKIRSSSRTPKRKKQSYAEDLEDTDSELSEEEEGEIDQGGGGEEEKKRIKKSKDGGAPLKKRLKRDSSTSSPVHLEEEDDEEGGGALTTLLHDVNQVDAPPPGVLPSLWYSRECVLHINVIEKILGWKSRPIVKLRVTKENEEEGEEIEFDDKKGLVTTGLDLQTAEKLRERSWVEHVQDSQKRMEISRINPINCPVVLSNFATSSSAASKDYTLNTNKTDREEVYLIKWRGKSHLHCSWERKRDLEKFDSTNNTARGKIKRYVQSQEALLGKHWKTVLEEERKAAAAPATHAHHHGHHHHEEDKKEVKKDGNAEEEETVEEEFFLPTYTEVERVLACDESELDLKVLAKQRAFNLKRIKEEEEENEDDEEAKKKKEDVREKEDLKSPFSEVKKAVAAKEEEEAWDPEDNVRYVVKWKGLQFQEMTWEYWRDIKHDFVDQVEDFWLRQRSAPSNDLVAKILGRKHPKITDYKKMTKSPLFGVSNKTRPVAKLEGEKIMVKEEPEEEEKENVENDESGLRLRAYQLEGVNWLLWNWWNRRSCILADEMGLGKTIQSVCFLQELQRQPTTQVRGPFLIVAPLSLISQWQSETEAWAPDMNVILYHGSADSRDFLVKQEFYYTDQFIPKTTATKLRRQHITKFHVLITTYEVVLKDVTVLSKVRWKALIVDEAHRLKNPKSRLFEELATVPRDFCVLLTGTPLQNSTEELWALLHFSDPVAFSSKEDFVNKFGQLTDARQVSELHSVLKPYLLRRVKEDVEKSLPPKEETILEVTLTPIQKTYYKAIYEKNTSFLFKGAKPSNAPSLMNIMMELRKCCNHPFLIRGAEERILADAAAASTAEGKTGTVSPEPTDYVKLTAEQLVKSSGKMVLLVKLLPKLYAGGHKVLIFSQMVRVLDLLEELLRMKHYRYERLDGSTSASSRAAAVDRFHRKSFQRFVMLLSTRAGGLGLNLTAADTVIIFDSDWNPQNDLQAMARAHRIGQTRAVRVYRLLTSKTYEMHMFHSASMKLGLDRAVLAHQRQHGAEDDDDSAKSKSKSKKEREIQAKEIDELLKKGAYDVFRDDDDIEAQQFMETDIDQLLERSSRKVTYGNTSTNSISSGLGSFSKASFVASTDDGKDVDLDDPDFWEKAVGLDAPAEAAADGSENLLLEKRNRRQVQVFDPYAAFAEAEQKKKDKVAEKAKQEKQEKERRRKERKEEKKRKKREKEEAREAKDKSFSKSSVAKKQGEVDKTFTKEKKASREGRSKKLKKAERRRAIRKAEREDPVLERIKQAWEVPQRNRATSAALRFGFGRFCKIRNESNFTSLPIQDLEVFVRTYVYQLALQASVSLLAKLQDRAEDEMQDLILDSPNAASELLSSILSPLSQSGGGPDIEWICNALMSSLKLYQEAKSGKSSLRIPLCLAEPSYVSELRAGAAFRALRRFAFLSRLNCVVENALDQVLADLGHEELGKRGCPTKDLFTLDADLKSRHVTVEELSHSLGTNLPPPRFCRDCAPPAPWWDRGCDLALIVGTFIHGLGNYEAMRLDEDLPFGRKISQYAANDPGTSKAFHTFEAAAYSARKVFDDALSNAKSKAQAEAHAAVAAAVAASKLAEEKEKEKRDGKTDGTNESETVKLPVSNKGSSSNGKGKKGSASDGALTTEKDDSDVITLHRLSVAMTKTTSSMQKAASLIKGNAIDGSTSDANSSNTKKETDGKPHLRLPMPDARCLDNLLSRLINKIEGSCEDNCYDETPNPGIDLSIASIISADKETRKSAVLKLLNRCNTSGYKHRECVRVAFSGSLCGTQHRTLDDSSDFFLGAASPDLLMVSSGADASRYQRGIGVPMVLSRYGLSAIIHADSDLIKKITTRKVKDDNASSQSSKNQESKDVSSKHDKSETKPKKETEKSRLKYSFKKVSPELKENELLRAGLCAALLHCGSPFDSRNESYSDVDYRLSNVLQGEEKSFFTMKTLVKIGGLFTDDQPSLEDKAVRKYFDNVLIPHCINICLSRTGIPLSSLKVTRKKSSVADADGKNPKNYFSTLPDPALPINLHSEVAVANALAILRRVRLTRAIRYVVGGGIPLEQLMSFLNGPVMRNSLDGVPVWWSPSIHDLAVLVHAAVHGLFAIFSDRTYQERMKSIQSVFSTSAIKKHIREVFVEGMDGKKPALPRNFLDNAKPGEIDAWVEAQALQFPTPNVIERRIAIICGEMTQDMGSGSNNDEKDESNKEKDFCRYDSIPMFDHGGWPKDEENGCGTLGLYSGTKNGIFASILHVAEGWYDNDANSFRQSSW